jgi:hypothetical protein
MFPELLATGIQMPVLIPGGLGSNVVGVFDIDV